MALLDVACLAAMCHSGLVGDDFPISDFYVTCATVIPVLFLALAVEGRAYMSLLVTMFKLGDYATQSRIMARKTWYDRRLIQHDAVLAVAMVPPFVAFLILVSGGGGEAMALAVLFHRSEFLLARIWVFWATAFLLAAVVAVPTVASIRLAPPSARARRGFAESTEPREAHEGPGTRPHYDA